MSFDIFLNRFRDGERSGFDPAVLDEVFGQHVIRREPRLVQVEISDLRGGADLYGDFGGPVDSITVNRPGGETFMNLLVELCARTGSSLVWGGDDGPVAAVADGGGLRHLPPDMVGEVSRIHVVGSGRALIDAIEGRDPGKGSARP